METQAAENLGEGEPVDEPEAPAFCARSNHASAPGTTATSGVTAPRLSRVFRSIVVIVGSLRVVFSQNTAHAWHASGSRL